MDGQRPHRLERSFVNLRSTGNYDYLILFGACGSSLDFIYSKIASIFLPNVDLSVNSVDIKIHLSNYKGKVKHDILVPINENNDKFIEDFNALCPRYVYLRRHVPHHQRKFHIARKSDIHTNFAIGTLNINTLNNSKKVQLSEFLSEYSISIFGLQEHMRRTDSWPRSVKGFNCF
jgi:hypothetical protein